MWDINSNYIKWLMHKFKNKSKIKFIIKFYYY